MGSCLLSKLSPFEIRALLKSMPARIKSITKPISTCIEGTGKDWSAYVPGLSEKNAAIQKTTGACEGI